MSNLKISNSFLFFIFFIVGFPFATKAETANASEIFAQGNKAYVAKDYPKAAEFFTQALDKDPNNSVTLTNLALTEFHLEKKSFSVALLRKALAIDPELSTAKSALKFISSQMQIKEVPHKIETYENLRSEFLQPVPTGAYAVASAICFFAAGWLLITFAAKRKKSLQEEQAPPSFPFIGVFLSLIFVTLTGLLILKLYDASRVRGTLVEDQVAVQTAPGDNGVSILDLYGGMEVVVNSTQGDWVQITYPGSLTGWIKKSALLMTR
ncbi:MAG: hypothetical protein ACXVCP_13585 [Bdellovibrio sp.]